MRTFTMLMLIMSCFVFLLNTFSFWMAFVLVYGAGLLLVSVIAVRGRRRGTAWYRGQQIVELEDEGYQAEA